MKPAGVKSIVEQIADAVLYEGYVLYPYRPSSLKNRQRWNFGGICPKSYADAGGESERSRVQTEILAETSPSSLMRIRLRFLHLVSRQVARLRRPVSDLRECADSDFENVESLKVGGRLFQTWQEAVEREVSGPEFTLQTCEETRAAFLFQFPCSRSIGAIHDESGQIVGALIRTQEQLDGSVSVSAEHVRDSLFRVRIQTSNLTVVRDGAELARDQAMMFSLASSHLILSIRDGEFVSLIDPPEKLAEIASACESVGMYPVLVGEDGERSTMLASPVILYDYPKIAPESAGNLFDGTEIDEILTLRIMALTDEEKSEMRQSDERAGRILDRIEADPEHLATLHGAIRSAGPAERRQP
jgi:hydrogenase maturation protease